MSTWQDERLLWLQLELQNCITKQPVFFSKSVKKLKRGVRASFQTFCLTARAYLNKQKYGLFCSLLQNHFQIIKNSVTEFQQTQLNGSPFLIYYSGQDHKLKSWSYLLRQIIRRSTCTGFWDKYQTLSLRKDRNWLKFEFVILRTLPAVKKEYTTIYSGEVTSIFFNLSDFIMNPATNCN